MIKPDWNTFKSKFTENPQDNFEWFSYLLFCKEHNLTFIHSYKNQAAIETDPVDIDGVLSGWQAKFYEGTLTEHKKDIVATIDKAIQYYVGIKRIYFYTNSEWGQAKGMEPQVKKDVEQYAEGKGIELKWLVKSTAKPTRRSSSRILKTSKTVSPKGKASQNNVKNVF